MAKTPGKDLQFGESCRGFRDHLASCRAAATPPSSWSAVEDGFLRAMEHFDSAVIADAQRWGEGLLRTITLWRHLKARRQERVQ